MSELDASEISNQKLKEEHLSQKNGLQVSHKLVSLICLGLFKNMAFYPT